ncbi:MAG TPA: AMP-binding protein [Candidatus Dormibacteraeota bacterium]|nr:AMP-binding protein [Candidatus Dormibacteraeota bacterium]
MRDAGEHNLTDYAAAVRDFRLEVPQRFNFARDVVGQWARDPERLGMHWLGQRGEERRITFREFDERSDRFAAVLRRHGVRAGDRVMVQLPRVPEWWEVLLGCFKVGAVAVPGTVLLTAKDISYRTNLAEGVVYVTDPDGAARVDEVRAECPTLRVLVQVGGEGRKGWLAYEREMDSAGSAGDVDTASSDPALIYFTSGTVGNPKMVLHTHASYPIGHRITGRFWLDLRPGDLHLNLSENGWAKAAWSSLFGPWNMGAALFVQDSRGRFNASETLDLLERYPITTFCAPPTAYRMLVLEDLSRRELRSLRWCVGAGEPLNPEVIETWERGTGHLIRDGYGQTETVLLCGNFPSLEVRPGSMGKPSPGMTVAVIDEEGRALPPDSEGDIALRFRPERPVGLFQEYWRNPEASEACRRGDWYVTGDRAYVDGDGYFWFVGRADDVIISAGYRIGPFEVESALIEHPAVAEAAVVGRGDPLRGTIVKAFVILAPGHSGSDQLTADLQDHVKRVTAPYKYPREIEYVSELPKTISGKIRRVELRS